MKGETRHLPKAGTGRLFELLDMLRGPLQIKQALSLCSPRSWEQGTWGWIECLPAWLDSIPSRENVPSARPGSR
jgi:hypothetical protein